MRPLVALAIAAGSALLAGPVLAQTGRPQLSPAEADRHQRADYLGDWQPEAIRLDGRPDFVVAADGSGSHRSVQAALDALPRTTGTRRWHIAIRPGRYVEQVCARLAVPVLLHGDPSDPGAVTISFSRHAAEAQQPPALLANPCMAHGGPQVGTAGSASAALIGDALQLAALTIRNDAMEPVRGGQGYPSGSGETGGAQAVALLLQGDRVQLDRVQIWGHQDSFYVRKPAGSPGRVWVHDSLIAGDVDFIFGDARLVIERSRILSRAGRRGPGEGGIVFAPSTTAAEPYGFLVTDSRLLGEPGLAPGSVALGRAWDQGVPKGQWRAGISPNGQLLVRDSRLGPHLGPWAASTARRPFTAEGDSAARLREFDNRPEAPGDNAP